MKQSQLILYKNFFNKQFGIDPDKIHIKFFIVKRKIWEQSDFVQKRVQEFIPASGPIKTKKAVGKMEEFINECFEPAGESRRGSIQNDHRQSLANGAHSTINLSIASLQGRS
jgi:hypothetical protein